MTEEFKFFVKINRSPYFLTIKLNNFIASHPNNSLEFTETVKVLEFFFYLLPQFNIGTAFQDVYTNYKYIEVCKKDEMSEKICENAGTFRNMSQQFNHIDVRWFEI